MLFFFLINKPFLTSMSKKVTFFICSNRSCKQLHWDGNDVHFLLSWEKYFHPLEKLTKFKSPLGENPLDTTTTTTTTFKPFVPSIWGRLHEPKENYAG